MQNSCKKVASEHPHEDVLAGLTRNLPVITLKRLKDRGWRVRFSMLPVDESLLNRQHVAPKHPNEDVIAGLTRNLLVKLLKRLKINRELFTFSLVLRMTI